MLNPDPYSRFTPERPPWLAGICADLAAEFNLPAGVVRAVLLVFLVLPTGLTYMALAWLAGRRHAGRGYGAARFSGPAGAAPLGRDVVMLRQRFGALEPRLSAIEAFVSSQDFELHKGFRQMRG